ncbi:MAG: hypothetical protein QOK05_2482 [Chloroflexota bacterium]|jgi:hypothetical protein|nr:hypothetical protein [Chloroflexota bacterium]
MSNLEDRLRDLPLRPPEDLKSRAMQAASTSEPGPARRGVGSWVQVAVTMSVVALVVILTLTLANTPASNVFSNISAGLGT